MTGSFATNPPAGIPDVVMRWAAVRLLCLWMRSDPESIARMLGADGFDAGFGLGGAG